MNRQASNFLYKGEQFLQTIWIGGLLAIGYLAVPILFNSLDDRQLAGALAGQMFSAMNMIGLVCGCMLLLSALATKSSSIMTLPRVAVLVVMLVIVLISSFGLQPAMQELKSMGLTEGSGAAAQFGRLHAVSSGLYLINSLLGLYLILAPRRRA